MAEQWERWVTAISARYIVGRKLGEGATAEVFAAHDAASGQPVALKVMRRDIAIEVGSQRFLQEMRVAASLDHPNIVRVLDSGEADGVPYQVMPLVPGETLRARLEREPQLTLATTLGIARQVASAIDAAHRYGIVHRDIKPENILLDGDQAFVTDFGVAYAIDVAVGDRITASGLTVGTPQYMSPEHSSAERRVDGRSDVYSLACVCFEMLAGQPPFTGATTQAIQARHVTEAPPSVRVVRRELPVAVDIALKIGLAKSPADRYPTATAFVEAFEAPEPARGRSWAWRWAAGLAVAAAGVAALSTAGTAPEKKGSLAPALDPAQIAVLYPVSSQNDPALAAVGRGLTRDLIYILARIPGLHVISEAGIRGVGPDSRIDSVALALGVGTVIVATLDRSRDSLDYDVRLVDARTMVEKKSIRGRWPMATLVSVRDTVARVASAELLGTIGREVEASAWQAETRSTTAWELQQRARDLQQFAAELPTNPRDFSPQVGALASADTLFARAAAADGDWEAPVVGRGWVRLVRSQFFTGAIQQAALDTAMRIATEVTRRWPRSPRALELRGAVRAGRWRNVPGTSTVVGDSAEADLRAATLSDGQLSRAWVALSDVLSRKGDSAGSDMAARRAVEADGYSANTGRVMVNLIFRHLFRRQFDSAGALCVVARRRFPLDAVVRSCELSVLGWSGTGAADLAAIRVAADQIEHSGAFPLVAGMFPVGRLWVAAVLARSGRRDSAAAELASTQSRLRANGNADEFAMNEAQVYVALGNSAAALERLERAVQREPAKRTLIAALPWFDPLRREPRFVELTKPR